MKKIKNYR